MTSTIAVTNGVGAQTGKLFAFDAVSTVTLTGLAAAYNGLALTGYVTSLDGKTALAPLATCTAGTTTATLVFDFRTRPCRSLFAQGNQTEQSVRLRVLVTATGQVVADATCAMVPGPESGLTTIATASAGATLAEAQALVDLHNLATAAHPFSAADKMRYGGTAGVVTEGTITALARTLLARATAVLMRGDLGAAPLAAVRHIWLPAGAAIPRATNGAAAGTVEAATNDVMYDVLDFDSATAEGIAWVVTLPEWNLGAIKFKPVWTAATGSGTFILSVAGRAYADDDAIDQAAGTAQTSTDTLITAGDIHIGPASSAITVAGTLAANLPIILQGVRDIADTLNADARLIGILVEYTKAATEEAAW